MSITKVDDLTTYEIYDNDEIAELIGYLESKTIQWYKLKDVLPKHQKLLVIRTFNFEVVSAYYSTRDSIFKPNLFIGKVVDTIILVEEKDVESWCYWDDFIKNDSTG